MASPLRPGEVRTQVPGRCPAAPLHLPQPVPHMFHGPLPAPRHPAPQPHQLQAQFPHPHRVVDPAPLVVGTVHRRLHGGRVGRLPGGQPDARQRHPRTAAAGRVARQHRQVRADLGPVQRLLGHRAVREPRRLLQPRRQRVRLRVPPRAHGRRDRRVRVARQRPALLQHQIGARALRRDPGQRPLVQLLLRRPPPAAQQGRQRLHVRGDATPRRAGGVRCDRKRRRPARSPAGTAGPARAARTAPARCPRRRADRGTASSRPPGAAAARPGTSARAAPCTARSRGWCGPAPGAAAAVCGPGAAPRHVHGQRAGRRGRRAQPGQHRLRLQRVGQLHDVRGVRAGQHRRGHRREHREHGRGVHQPSPAQRRRRQQQHGPGHGPSPVDHLPQHRNRCGRKRGVTAVNVPLRGVRPPRPGRAAPRTRWCRPPDAPGSAAASGPVRSAPERPGPSAAGRRPRPPAPPPPP